jgi:hypothetical protein
MNKITLSFQVRLTAVRTNGWVTIYTSAGEVLAQYCPCTETFSIDSNGCHKWTYTFCIQDTDLPSAIETACGLTSDMVVPPYVAAIPPINLADSQTVDVQGTGTELDPYNYGS